MRPLRAVPEIVRDLQLVQQRMHLLVVRPEAFVPGQDQPSGALNGVRIGP